MTHTQTEQLCSSLWGIKEKNESLRAHGLTDTRYLCPRWTAVKGSSVGNESGWELQRDHWKKEPFAEWPRMDQKFGSCSKQMEGNPDGKISRHTEQSMGQQDAWWRTSWTQGVTATGREAQTSVWSDAQQQEAWSSFQMRLFLCRPSTEMGLQQWFSASLDFTWCK